MPRVHKDGTRKRSSAPSPKATQEDKVNSVVAKESDVATAVAFLAADSSEMITGTSLLVDGGWTAQ